MELCKELFPEAWGKDVWSPNSPDLNPMDYSVWLILEQYIPGICYNNIETLKVALLRAWDEITAEQLTTIIQNFPKRLRASIKENGDNFKYLL